MTIGETGAAQLAAQLAGRWENDPRWSGIRRTYTAEQVLKLRGTVTVEHSLARLGAERLWSLLQREPFVRSLGAVTGNQAVQMVQAGLKAIYLSGWQVAGDANNAGQTYPDQSLYPADSAPALVKRLNNALLRELLQDEGNWFLTTMRDAQNFRGWTGVIRMPGGG